MPKIRVHADRTEHLNQFFDSYRSDDEYDSNAITHVMAHCSCLPGNLLSERAAIGFSQCFLDS